MVYIDLNMVRAGVVEHPSDWVHAGFNEIQALPEKYRCIDVPALTTLLGFSDTEALQAGLQEWVDMTLAGGSAEHEPAWTRSIAVGQRDYLDAISRKLRRNHPTCKIKGTGDHLYLREECSAYMIEKTVKKHVPG
jgi:putative transposase